MEDDLAAPEALIREVVVRIAGPLIDAGRATLEVRPAGAHDPDSPADVELKPANPEACSLGVGTDVLGEAHVTVGDHGTSFEIWSSKDLGYFESYLEKIVSGVIAGGYEEWVHRDRPHKTFARFSNVPGSRILSNLLWFPRWSRDAYEHVRYEPY